MTLNTLENYTPQYHHPIDCDLFINYSCSESRSTNVLEKLSITAGKICTLVDKTSTHYTSIDDQHPDHYSSIASLLKVIKTFLAGTTIKIVADISCLPRKQMADLLATIIQTSTETNIELIVLYSLAEFTPPNDNTLANLSIEPVHKAFAGWSTPETKPTSLILGLGYEPDKAEGASEYFEPSDQWVFIPKSPVLEFFDQVNQNNYNLIQETDDNHLIEYDVNDPEMTYGQLELVISTLVRSSNPVLLPFGPKIFFFLCLIQCLTHPELGVWQVESEESSATVDVTASEHIIGVRCLFGSI
ncbi:MULTISPECIES: hypothetical protein [Pseudomonas]|uniref:hypothetical protein n=1 Tax=Pseudomonas TaxID=286 RepID=UPI001A9D1A8C|nr:MULTISPECIES: hypothetical protein [Pseudomonas]MDH1259178.1 hypothetical protein [Pseudomonas atacamensis]